MLSDFSAFAEDDVEDLGMTFCTTEAIFFMSFLNDARSARFGACGIIGIVCAAPAIVVVKVVLLA